MPLFPHSDYCTGAAGSMGIVEALIKRAKIGSSYVVDAVSFSLSFPLAPPHLSLSPPLSSTASSQMHRTLPSRRSIASVHLEYRFRCLSMGPLSWRRVRMCRDTQWALLFDFVDRLWWNLGH
ncbi:hypothetical protein BDQ12DRAFT_693684 [Crucibulum laeve]|uniref:Uncharacterized protein n=1 Tax=Crucibulum laeve TaxID=68775 RepID=A0A5C3LFX9_9AGAR|nr:hypothetical protein BDQ12DRAFT_693684 [Crucibulum laeve]